MIVLTGGCDLPPMPSITREYHIHVACPEKKKAKLRIGGAVSTEHILLLHHHKEEKLLTIRSQGLLVHPLRETRGLPFTKASRNSLRTLASSKSAGAAVLYMLGVMTGDTATEIRSWVLTGIMRSSTGSVVTLSDHIKLDEKGAGPG